MVAVLLAGCKSTSRQVTAPAAQTNAREAAVAEAERAGTPARFVAATSNAPADAPERLPPPLPDGDATVAILSLDEAVTWGLQGNPRLRQKGAEAMMAEADADVAFAPFLPEFGTSFRYAGFTDPVIPGGSFVPASLPAGVTSFVIAEVGVQYTIADFGRRAGHYGVAVHRARSRDLAWSRAQQTIAFEVVDAYFNLLAAHANVRVREEALRDAERILDDTRARLDGGVVDREAVLRAEVELSLAQQMLLSARQAVSDAAATLNVVMGRSPVAPLHVEEVMARPEFDRSIEECLGEAVFARREIGMAREAVAEAEHGVEAARAEYWPKVYVRGTALQADSPGDLNGSIEGIGLHVDQPLYAGGRYENGIRSRQAQVAAAIAGLQAIVDNVSLQVSVTYQAIRTGRQRIELAERSVVAAEENLRLTIVRYRNADATPTDIVDAETALVQARTSYNTAVFGYLQGLARLEYALGYGQERLLDELRAGDRPAAEAMIEVPNVARGESSSEVPRRY